MITMRASAQALLQVRAAAAAARPVRGMRRSAHVTGASLACVHCMPQCAQRILDDWGRPVRACVHVCCGVCLAFQDHSSRPAPGPGS